MAKPLLILLAGFQGSGKTALAQKLVDKYNLTLISPDKIRQELFDRGVKFSEDFVKLVDKTRDEQIQKTISAGQDAICDTNMIPARIAKIKKDLASCNYQLITIFLDAPQDILTSRITTRPQEKGVYPGTTKELEDSLEKFGDVDKKGYDLVIDTQKYNPEQTFEAVAPEIMRAIAGLGKKV